MKIITIAFYTVIILLIMIVLLQNNKIVNLENDITVPEEITEIDNEEPQVNFNDTIYMKSLKDEIKRKNKIIGIDDKLLSLHSRELELYGDFIVGIVRGNDREERLNREDVLKTGERIMEIQKDIEKLKENRKQQ